MSVTILNTKVEQKISLYIAFDFLTKQPTLSVIMSGELSPSDCHMFPGLQQHLGDHNLNIIARWKQLLRDCW